MLFLFLIVGAGHPARPGPAHIILYTVYNMYIYIYMCAPRPHGDLPDLSIKMQKRRNRVKRQHIYTSVNKCETCDKVEHEIRQLQTYKTQIRKIRNTKSKGNTGEPCETYEKCEKQK